MAISAGTRRDRLMALFVVFAVAGICWAWLGKTVWDMSVMSAGGMAAAGGSGPGYALWLVVMWLVMMAAMMLPSAVPVIVAFADFAGRRTPRFDVRLPMAFIAGYVAAWAAFSLSVGIAQWSLERSAAMSRTTMALENGVVAGLVVAAAGLYQWTPLKHACLRKCRTPIGFLMTEWREGTGGAFTMGWRHGILCVGCCWALMALLFAVGVMNPLWILGLMLFVIAEKTLPAGEPVARAAGALLVVVGILMAAGLGG